MICYSNQHIHLGYTYNKCFGHCTPTFFRLYKDRHLRWFDGIMAEMLIDMPVQIAKKIIYLLKYI